MAWSPLGGGDLMTQKSTLGDLLDRFAARDGVDRAAVATAFLLAHPAQILSVLGTNNISRIVNFRRIKGQLDRQDWFELYEAARGEPVA